ncbi:hypothetical protein CSOJ01_04848 [Colletotrichum sojae]|uniref:GPI anchored serine-threonine rich protein n=1 Tax=Colletotrichum sojae TaxID=2175907 RepID=A0A8H6JI92_9PEZI|nr:hypothetical protein CSOJ01_04848 [Colletotrichum sojae]
MKFFLPIALLAAAVAAQDPKCDAEPIVEACLASENAKVSLNPVSESLGLECHCWNTEEAFSEGVIACNTTDYDCLCAAYQSVATCYNNCPKDSRASPAQNQVTIFCQQASLYGSKAQQKTATPSGSATAAVASNAATATPSATTGEDAASTTASVSPTSTPNLGVGQLARNTGGVLLAVAGVVAAVL